jgi:hypothetical protein
LKINTIGYYDIKPTLFGLIIAILWLVYTKLVASNQKKGAFKTI